MNIKDRIVRRLLGEMPDCPKCKFKLKKYPSLYYKSIGYKYYCEVCDEEFYGLEVEE